MSNTYFIPTQGNQILAEQNKQKKDIVYKDNPFSLLNEKFSTLKAFQNISHIISKSGKDNLEAINLFNNFSSKKQELLNATVAQLEIQKTTNNTHKENLKQNINVANTKMLKPEY